MSPVTLKGNSDGANEDSRKRRNDSGTVSPAKAAKPELPVSWFDTFWFKRSPVRISLLIA